MISEQILLGGVPDICGWRGCKNALFVTKLRSVLPICMDWQRNRFRVLLVHEQMALISLTWVMMISLDLCNMLDPHFVDGCVFLLDIPDGSFADGNPNKQLLILFAFCISSTRTKRASKDDCPILTRWDSWNALINDISRNFDMRRCLFRHDFDNPFLLVSSESGISVTLRGGFLLR
jgi:hypothetical protein